MMGIPPSPRHSTVRLKIPHGGGRLPVACAARHVHTGQKGEVADGMQQLQITQSRSPEASRLQKGLNG